LRVLPSPDEEGKWLDLSESVWNCIENQAHKRLAALDKLAERPAEQGLEPAVVSTPTQHPPEDNKRLSWIGNGRRIRVCRWTPCHGARPNPRIAGLGPHFTYASAATLTSRIHHFLRARLPISRRYGSSSRHATPHLRSRIGRAHDDINPEFSAGLAPGETLIVIRIPSDAGPLQFPPFDGPGPLLSIYQARFTRYLRARAGERKTKSVAYWRW